MSEQQFTTQPHPAKSNDPADLQDNSSADAIESRHSGLGGAPNLQGLQKAAADVTGGKGPHVPSQDIANSLEQPKSREELQAAQAKLNE